MIASTNPMTGTVDQAFEPHDDTEVEARLGRAADGFHQNRGLSLAERAQRMRSAADLLDADAEHLAIMITKEMGKPLAQARTEVAKSARAMRYYADAAAGFLAPEPLDDPTAVQADTAYAAYEPLGVILAVMPWNYPVWQVIRFAAPTLMAGNAGLLKHASNVPQVALYLDSLFSRAGFPAGAFQTLLIPASRVDAIIRDDRVAAVTLTGSEPAGRAVARTAGDVVKPSILELGGSDPFLVLPSADLERAAAAATTARVSNNGQACINAKRFLVHTAVYDAFLALLKEKYAALRLGDPMSPTTDVGPLALASGRDEVADLVEDARRSGAEVFIAHDLPDAGWYFAPTILANVTPAARIYREEAFGPVATVIQVADVAEAIAVANDSPFGLGATAWTTDEQEIQRLTAELEAGTVTINGYTLSYQELPFGGIKRSGYGRELAAAGIRAFCNLKAVRIVR